MGGYYTPTVPAERYAEIFRSHGFTTSLIEVPCKLTVPSVADFMNLLGFFYHFDLGKIKQESKNEIYNFLMDRFGNKKVEFSFPQLVVVAKKK